MTGLLRGPCTITIAVAAFAGVAATAWGSRPATAHDRASMTRAVQQWVHRDGGGNCRLIRQRVSTVDRSWASAWVGGRCGRGSADIYGDLVVFHHNGQDRPGVWRVKGVWSDTGACSSVPTRVLVDLGVAGNRVACARDYEEAQKHETENEYRQRVTHEAEERCAAKGGRFMEEGNQGQYANVPPSISIVFVCEVNGERSPV
jgi:hypothetical protein